MINLKALKILLVWNGTITLLILFRGGKTSKSLTRRNSQQHDGIRIGIRFFFELQDPVSLYQDNGDLWVESFGDDGA